MAVSKFYKIDKNILIEFIYNDGNNIGEPYNVLVNIKNNKLSFLSGNSSVTNNIQANQLIQLDPITNNYGIVNTSNYNFLQIKEYATGFPIRYDTIKIHLPVNYTFGEYIGCHLRLYGFDYENTKTIDLSNFFFDMTNIDQSYLLNYTNPPFKFQEKLWGKYLVVNIPALSVLSNQRVNNSTKINSINYNLTNGVGFNMTSPVFIDFQFITKSNLLNSIKTYYLTTPTTISIPQQPEFETLGVKIQHSINGDFFEIYGTYNGDSSEFNTFLLNAVQLGNRYYVEYTITLYEQNIRGKSFNILVTNNFSDTIEYRPIIKNSTTTAIIDVEMNIIDAVDNSTIYRKASYGMLQDEVAKYSLNLTKINLLNAHKPKIYNIKNAAGAGIFGSLNIPQYNINNNASNGNNSGSSNSGSGNSNNAQLSPQIVLEPINVNHTVLADKYNIVAKSENVKVGKKNFYGIGKLKLDLNPFDNIIQLIIAQDVSNEQKIINSGNGSKIEYVAAPQYMDMSNMGIINLVIQNNQISIKTGLYTTSNSVNLASGVVVFKIPESKMKDVRKIYDSGINVFYITSTLNSSTTQVYAGLFNIYDSTTNVKNLNDTVAQIQAGLNNTQEPSIINDPNSGQTGTAIVTRIITNNPSNSSLTSATASSITSAPTSTKINNITYTITTTSGLTVNGYTWTNSQLKVAGGLSSNPNNLTIKNDSLYTNGKLIGKLNDLSSQLQGIFLDTADKKTIYTSTQNSFLNT